MFTPKQLKAFELFGSHPYVLLYGGARSGKTWVTVSWIILRCHLYPNTRAIICRRYATDVRASIWGQTIPSVLKDLDMASGTDYTARQQEMELNLSNGSQITCAGLDDKERVDKILGREYAVIYINESQDIPWPTVKTLRTRLSQNTDAINQLICDLNPTTTAHWAYRQWIQGIDPETKTPYPDAYRADYACLQMNPHDNEANLPEGYIERELASLTGDQRNRFFLGEFTNLSTLQVFNPSFTYKWKQLISWIEEDPYRVKLTAGLDLGFNDADALAIVAYREDSRQFWLVYEMKGKRHTLTDTAAMVKKALSWVEAALPMVRDTEFPIFTDQGGGGKKVAYELKSSFGLNIQQAKKTKKAMAIELLQGWVNEGRIAIPLDGPFHEEATQIVWTRESDGTIVRIIDDNAYHPDMMDALLYAMRDVFVQTDGLKYIDNELLTPVIDGDTIPDEMMDRLLSSQNDGYF